jgi:spermidine synthase
MIFDKKEDIYIEDVVDEFGVKHVWDMIDKEFSVTTKKGTKVDIINKPKWGLTCYMDNSIQSCLKDEKIYHESLVHPAMTSVKGAERVCIIGGGEGATVREVLKFKSVIHVDMIEWDKEVVNLFMNEYPEWSDGAWNDSRLNIKYEDVFDYVTKFRPQNSDKYDVIIVDLFDPDDSNLNKWKVLLSNLPHWLSNKGSIVLYSGMRNILLNNEQTYMKIINITKSDNEWRNIPLDYYDLNTNIIPYKVYIPSFTGESTFILIKNKDSVIDFDKCSINTHINNNIWKSYITWNW